MATNFTATLIRRAMDESGDVELTFSVKGYANKQIAINVEKSSPFRVSLTEIGKKRSLEQNALMWALIHEISEVMHQSDEDTYINVLELANVKYEYVASLPQAEGLLKESFRALKLMNQFEHNGLTFNQYKAFYGSSKLNTKEMAQLLETVLQMARELDIPVDEEMYL